MFLVPVCILSRCVVTQCCGMSKGIISFHSSLNVPLSSSDCVVKLMAAPEGGRVHRGGGVMGIILAAKSYRGPSAEIKYRGGN